MRPALVGGAGIERGLVRAAESVGITVVSTYGMTETCGGCVYDGAPLDGVQVRIGDDGLIEIAGPTLFEGYRGLPPRSGEWFTTCDLGVIEADGRVNVPTRAVRAVLRTQPGVDDIEVLGIPDEEWGERVVAFVVGSAELEALRDAIDPRAWAPRQLVRLAELPRLESGKVDRVRLRKLAG